MKCKVCSRELREEGFCTLHLKAYMNLKEKFSGWKRASDVSWSQYLEEVQKNSLTGVWAKEVSKYLIKEANKDGK
jgi:hypothetical protein